MRNITTAIFAAFTLALVLAACGGGGGGSGRGLTIGLPTTQSAYDIQVSGPPPMACRWTVPLRSR
ncbi:MAG: hypothetical protein M5U25_18735 [Planctomycetota bacterium]|nr:hypothetical protein [Planctomycetota bacterium]